MSEKPILFSGSMVRAILAGTKTQTRRIVTPANSTSNGTPAAQDWPNLLFDHAEARTGSIWGKDDLHLAVPYRHPNDAGMTEDECGKYRVRPKWQVGDRLWVRETWQIYFDAGNGGWSVLRPTGSTDQNGKVFYRATMDEPDPNQEGRLIWRPSIFMPRWASRLTLEIVAVRVERVQEISDADCFAEGVRPSMDGNAHDWRHDENGWHRTFRQLWDSINAKRGFGWDANPFVWVVEFRRLEQRKAKA